MFYLIDKQNNLIREHDDRRALRKIKRKQPKSETLSIIEGDSFKKALTNATVEEKAPKEKKTKDKKKIKKVKTPKVKEKKEKKTKKEKKSKDKKTKELPERLSSR